MPYLIAILAAALLFFGFLLVTVYEAERGRRFFAASRYRLDTKVAHALFVIEHVDWSAFTAHLTRTTLTTLAHDIAHGSLIVVRGTERVLTRAVRALRMRRDDAAALPPPVKPAHAAAVETTVTELPPGSGSASSPAPAAASAPRQEPAIPAVESETAPETGMTAEPVGEHAPAAGPASQEPPDEAHKPAPPSPRTKSFDIRPPSRRK